MSRTRRLGAAAFLGLAGSLLLTQPAWAHVTISPDTSGPGQSAQIAFRVPNERDDASTVKLEVVFPPDHPLNSVSVEDVPGWTATVHKQQSAAPVQTEDGGQAGEVVTSITWEGGQIQPDHFQEFPVRLGRLGAGQLMFKTVQTYSNGVVVRWIDGPESGADAEHPAPVLTVATPAPPAVATESGPDVFARIMGGTGLAAGLAALAWRARSRERTPAAEPVGDNSKTEVGV